LRSRLGVQPITNVSNDNNFATRNYRKMKISAFDITTKLDIIPSPDPRCDKFS
jgi:hypothetical protein